MCYKKTLFLALFGFMSFNIFSQVTIGSALAPKQGAILDLKENEANDGGETSTKGLGLPRVSLVAIDKLEPCAETNVDNASAHTGLVVYNITNNSNSAATLQEGVYFWDGSLWQKSGLQGTQGFGPWYQVENPTLPSRQSDTDSYLNAKAVVGGSEILNDATLSVYGNTIIQGKVDVPVDEPSAILNLQSSNKGLLVPKVFLKSFSDGETIEQPAKGLVVYNTNAGLIKGEGFYANYGDKTNPNWIAFVNFEENDPSRYEMGDIVTKGAAKAVIVRDIEPVQIVNNIDLGMEQTIILDPKTRNKIVMAYSIPAGSLNTPTDYKGHIGIRCVKKVDDGEFAEMESGSRKYSIPVSNDIFMTTIGATVVETIENTSDVKMEVTYKLNGYVEVSKNSAAFNVIFNKWQTDEISSNHGQNYNWGEGSLIVETFYQLIKN